MLTHRETQTKTIAEITDEARKLFPLKAPKLVKRVKGAARK